MNIIEFILVLVFSTSAGATMTKIPGYYSNKECTDAGKIYVADIDGRYDVAKFACIPRDTGSKER